MLVKVSILMQFLSAEQFYKIYGNGKGNKSPSLIASLLFDT